MMDRFFVFHESKVSVECSSEWWEWWNRETHAKIVLASYRHARLHISLPSIASSPYSVAAGVAEHITGVECLSEREASELTGNYALTPEQREDIFSLLKPAIRGSRNRRYYWGRDVARFISVYAWRCHNCGRHKINNDRFYCPTCRNGCVYFLTSPETPHLVRVGHTINLKTRERKHQGSSPVPVSISFAIPGSLELERQIHESLQPFKSDIPGHGSWYRVTPEVKDVMASHSANAIVMARATLQ